jgi:hypothetical protein
LEEEKKIAKKLYPFSYSNCPNPLTILVPEEILRKEVGGQLKNSPGSGSQSGGWSQLFCKLTHSK